MCWITKDMAILFPFNILITGTEIHMYWIVNIRPTGDSRLNILIKPSIGLSIKYGMKLLHKRWYIPRTQNAKYVKHPKGVYYELHFMLPENNKSIQMLIFLYPKRSNVGNFSNLSTLKPLKNILSASVIVHLPDTSI